MSTASPRLQPRVLLLGVGSVVLPTFVAVAFLESLVTDGSPWLYLIGLVVLVPVLACALGARHMQRRWQPSAKPAYDRVVIWTVLLCVVALFIYSVASNDLSGVGFVAMLIVAGRLVTRLRRPAPAIDRSSDMSSVLSSGQE